MAKRRSAASSLSSRAAKKPKQLEPTKAKSSQKKKPKQPLEEEGEEAFLQLEGDLKDFSGIPKRTNRRRKPTKDNTGASTSAAADEEDEDEGYISNAKIIGECIEAEEARRRWPSRYPTREVMAERMKQIAGRKKSNDEDDDDFMEANAHFTKAEVDGVLYDLYDDASVRAGEGEPNNYICKIIEMFEAKDGVLYFNAQWYYRATDTVILNSFGIDSHRVFYSDIRNINPLGCLVKKLNIARFGININPNRKSELIEGCDFYCDTKYLLPYSTFQNFPPESGHAESDKSSTISSEVDEFNMKAQSGKTEPRRLLDLYSGCGGMSTGLCEGASFSSLNLVTEWAVDLNKRALESLKWNHRDTKVRHEAAEDFLQLLKEWKRLCVHFHLVDSDGSEEPITCFRNNADEEEAVEENDVDADRSYFNVEKIIDICYGKLPKKAKKAEERKSELLFKVHWEGYASNDDTWEPITSLRNCEEAIQEFVSEGFDDKLLPLPGDVHVVCGGPPCQGISGYNRYRNAKEPLKDEKNKQVIVFMDIVQYLKPEYVLMENVVDILKFAEGFLGRYALGRLVGMDYQARMGLMCAGAYGLPQFRMRVFLWGALPTERLPQFPLPTHDVVFRGQVPIKWRVNHVAYNDGHSIKLSRKLLLIDALSDLPAVANGEGNDSMSYAKTPQTKFQKFIRRNKEDLMSSQLNKKLYDHCPLKLNNDDFQRVCRIPKRKGANFRDLPCVVVDTKNVVCWNPEVDREYLPSGKPLVPDYAMSFEEGTSTKPFGRLWWDEIVPTVVTRAQPHNHVTLHPVQDRVLTVRENARLQGFPDHYQLCGTVKQRYIQIGNAVAVPVSRALGYSLGLASTGCAEDGALLTLPKDIHLPEGCSEEASTEVVV